MSSKIPIKLKMAYLATSYETCEEPFLLIRIGELNDDLKNLMISKYYSSWAFITAENPRSVKLSDEDNKARNEQLANKLREKDFVFHKALGVPDDTNWQAEKSFLVFDIKRSDAIALAKEFGQNAFVYGEIDSSAELVMVDHE